VPSTRAFAQLVLSFLLSGCLAVAAAGTGSSVGYVASEDRTIKENADDIVACTQAIQMWAAYNTVLNDDLNCRTYQGRMLVTGNVPTQEWRDAAIARAWKAQHVKEVYDEIKVGQSEGFPSGAKDALISEKLKAHLLTDADVHSNNYIVTTENGVLYILGSAHSEAERDRVMAYARSTPDVRRIVSFINVHANPAAAAAPAYTPTGEAAPAPSAAPVPDGTAGNAPAAQGDVTVTPLK
jgi:osmotically-inducible protein OsmY